MRGWEREMRNPAEEKWPAHNWFGVIGLLEQRPSTCHHHHPYLCEANALPVFIINIKSLEPNCFCRQLAASLFPFQY